MNFSYMTVKSNKYIIDSNIKFKFKLMIKFFNYILKS